MLQDGYAPLSTVLGLREFSRFKHTAEEVEELVEKDAKKRFELTRDWVAVQELNLGCHTIRTQ